MHTSALRTRWAAIGAAVAVTLGAGGVGLVAATSPSGAVAYVPIEPCRAADTRPAPDNVGPRNTPIGAAETHVVNSNHGGCAGDVPGTATGLQLNVTATGASAASFITIWASGPLPLASSLNPTPGQPPVPNAVTTSITGAGNFNIYNNVGSVHVIVDIVGYYTDHQHTGADIVDGSLTAVDIRDEPGVASDYMTNVVQATATPAAIASTSIRVPADGYVKMEVTGAWTNLDGGSDEVFCQLQKGTVGAVDTAQPWFSLRDRTTAAAYTGFSAHRIVPISVADNPLFFTSGQGISLVCDEQTGDVRFDDVYISATYYPTNYRPAGLIIFPLDEGEGMPQADSDG